MDTQWCLTCNRHLESSDQVYCSSECYNDDNPSMTRSSLFDCYDSSSVQQPVPPLTMWPASNHEGILAWARNVSPGIPSEERTPSPRRPASKPVLLSTGMSTRPLAPALSVASSPVLAHPSHPIQTPRSSERPRPSFYHQSAGGFSTTTTSLATESIATPISGEDEAVTSPAEAPRPPQSSMIGAFAKHVRTWVGNSSSRQVPPPKRSPQDPAVAGVDPTPLSLARSRGTSSLYVADEDVLLSKDVFVDWLGRPKQPSKPLYEPAPRDHPAFRARGRKAARAVAC
ncbi:hypothetical protein F5148DRAFT_974962 [Russula earlei]|uniref:Uncharacterized protein n=1 Tax=Russula earlei TaxID=71964 RepID=A0ACC0UKF7_9AGAM|nr:hypothetical protein F5148DRAFT_974962 [Russula earlei]